MVCLISAQSDTDYHKSDSSLCQVEKYIKFKVFLTIAVSNVLGHALFEPKFVNRNPVVEALAQKYNFTVFDFALAKKESHLK